MRSTRTNAYLVMNTAEREAAYKRTGGHPVEPKARLDTSLRDALVKAAAAATEARVQAKLAGIAREADQARRIKAAQAVLLQQVGGRRINASAPTDLTKRDAKRLFDACYPTLFADQQKPIELAVWRAYEALVPKPKTVKDAVDRLKRQVSGEKAPTVPVMFDRIADEVDDEVALATLVWDLSVARDHAETGAAVRALVTFIDEFTEARASAA